MDQHRTRRTPTPPPVTGADVDRWFDGHQRKLKPCSIPSVAAFIESCCSERYMVTLTDRRKLTSGDLSREVGWVLHRTNQAFFGTHYKRRRQVFLATYTVHETTHKDGLHAHILVGVPAGSLNLKPFKPKVAVADFIVNEWRGTAPNYRRAMAQDWRPMTHLAGAFSYVQKAFQSTNDIDSLDVGNTIFPTAYAVPRHAGE